MASHTAARHDVRVARAITPFILSVALAASALGQGHGVVILKECDGPTKVGTAVVCTSTLRHDDTFQDTLRVEQAYDLIDPSGSATRVPAIGNLPMVEILGNARYDGVVGELPVIIGPPNSMVNGLPGFPIPGAVVVVQDEYIAQSSDVGPLSVQVSFVVVDQCDDPDTEGCFGAPSTQQFASETMVFDAGVDVALSPSAPDVCVDQPVTYMYVVTNPDTVPPGYAVSLADVVLTDDSCSEGAPGTPLTPVAGDVNMNGLLDTGEAWTYECTTTPTGPTTTTNTATVTATDVTFACDVSDADSATVTIVSCGDYERAHPGWNWVDVARDWTADQPAYWSALTGAPGPDDAAVPPFTILDPPDDPLTNGRPATDGSTDRVLRGFIYAWAVDDEDREIAWNHLEGGVTVVNYRDGRAWAYNAWAFQDAQDLAPGTLLGGVAGPGVLEFDGIEYVPVFSHLLLDFYAPGSGAFGAEGTLIDTDLTLHPLRADLRQETTGPITTKATFVIWNEDETQFTNLHRCLTCWDQQLLSLYTEGGVQNHFLSLQTDKGKTRIDGVASQLCSSTCCLARTTGGCDDFTCQEQVCDIDPFCCASAWDIGCAGLAVDLCDACDSINVEAPLLGVAAKLISFPNDRSDMAGTNLIGLGLESASVRYDLEPNGGNDPPILTRDDPWVNAVTHDLQGAGVVPALSEPTAPAQDALIGAAADRVSGTEKGSFLAFSSIELRWAANGDLIQDAFISLTNDLDEPVRIKMYFVNGDPPLDAE